MGAAANHDGILDLVYETSVDPAVWPTLLGRFAQAMGGHSAALRSYYVPTEIGTVVAAGQDADALDRQFRNFASRNPLKSSLEVLEAKARSYHRAAYLPGTMMDVQWLPKDEFVQTDYYREVYQPRDIHSDISIGFDAKDLYWNGVDVYRAKSQGAFTDEELALCAFLHPHMVRAWKLSRKLSDTRSLGEGLLDFADRSPHGLFVLDRAGLVRHANAAGERILAQSKGLRMVGGRLTGDSQDATRRLQAMVAAAGGSKGARAGGSMALASPDGLRPLSLIVAPMGAEQAAPLHDGPAVMVCVTDLDAKVSLPEQRLRELFDLTPAETRVALALFEGFEPKSAAEQLEISVWTVRRHLAQIFEKTHTGSQVELARLMMRAIGAAGG